MCYYSELLTPRMPRHRYSTYRPVEKLATGVDSPVHVYQDSFCLLPSFFCLWDDSGNFLVKSVHSFDGFLLLTGNDEIATFFFRKGIKLLREFVFVRVPSLSYTRRVYFLLRETRKSRFKEMFPRTIVKHRVL